MVFRHNWRRHPEDGGSFVYLNRSSDADNKHATSVAVPTSPCARTDCTRAASETDPKQKHSMLVQLVCTCLTFS